MTDLRLICVHEAGHAIAALHFNRIVECMMLVPKSNPPAKTSRGLCDDDGDNRIIAVAGIVAESIFLNRTLLNSYQRFLINDYSGGGYADLYNVYHTYVNTRLTENQAYCDAWKILHPCMNTILNLANALYEKRYLSRMNVEEIVLNIHPPIFDQFIDFLICSIQRLRLRWF